MTLPQKKILFDDSLRRLTEVVCKLFGDEILEKSVFLRDAVGRLAFIVSREAKSKKERANATREIINALGSYSIVDNPIAFWNDPGANRLLDDPARLPIQVASKFCQLIDRRIVGVGWLEMPTETIPQPPRVVFASLKGGVGRSTALAVAASDLAKRNRNVLVVDMDLEAPGLGALLLDDERMPKFGTLDFLVENGIGGVADDLLSDYIGTSALTTGGGGRVDVVPAFGQKSNENPENVLPKLSRAMLDDVSDDGSVVSLSAQIEAMIERLTSLNAYDAVFVDSRAGLAELAAPTVLGLGATTLLFGTAQYQTIQGYRALFAAFKLLAQRDKYESRKANWRLNLKAVYSKASLDDKSAARHLDDLYDLFADNLYDAQTYETATSDDVSFGIDEANAPHHPLIIPFSQSFVNFDPTRNPNQLTAEFYEQAYRPFLNGIDAILSNNAIT